MYSPRPMAVKMHEILRCLHTNFRSFKAIHALFWQKGEGKRISPNSILTIATTDNNTSQSPLSFRLLLLLLLLQDDDSSPANGTWNSDLSLDDPFRSRTETLTWLGVCLRYWLQKC